MILQSAHTTTDVGETFFCFFLHRRLIVINLINLICMALLNRIAWQRFTLKKQKYIIIINSHFISEMQQLTRITTEAPVGIITTKQKTNVFRFFSEAAQRQRDDRQRWAGTGRVFQEAGPDRKSRKLA